LFFILIIAAKKDFIKEKEKNKPRGN